MATPLGPDGQTPWPHVTVVVMAYNEVATLESTVHEIAGALTHLDVPSEVLIIDDGSTDGTGELAAQLASTMPAVRVETHKVNLGLGGVYRTGFGEARGSYVTFFPADGQFPASIIERFVSLAPDHDLILGYLPERPGMHLSRALSAMERAMYGLLFGSFPRFQGVLMFRRSLLREMRLLSDGRGWAVLMEFILRSVRMGYRVISVPTTVRPRSAGHSKVNNLRTIWANLRQVVGLRRLLGETAPGDSARYVHPA